jgi:hypothetical protein
MNAPLTTNPNVTKALALSEQAGLLFSSKPEISMTQLRDAVLLLSQANVLLIKALTGRSGPLA